MENKNLREVDWGFIPNHWEVKTTEEITDFITDYVANGSFASLAENVNYKSTPDYAALIRLTDYNNNFKGDFVYVDKRAYDFLKKSKLEGGEVIISNVGAYAGTVFLAPKLDIPTTLGPNSIMMNFKTDNLFYYYWLKSLYGQHMLEGIISGSAQPKFNKTSFRKLEVPVPPLPEQKAIASVLSSLDDKIDLLHQQNQTLEALAETLFRQWFIEEAKEDWEQLRIVDLFEVKDGTHDSPKQKEFGKKLITSKHLFNFYIDFNSAYFISEEDYYNINKRSKVEKGDILFSMIGTIGNIYLEDSENIDYAIKNIGLFKTSQNLNWRYFTYLWLKSNLGRDFIFENISGSTQEYISLGSLRSIIFKVPNIETVDLFNTKVKTLFDKLYINQQQIQTLTQLRDTLLPKLMSGEVRVQL